MTPQYTVKTFTDWHAEAIDTWHVLHGTNSVIPSLNLPLMYHLWNLDKLPMQIHILYDGEAPLGILPLEQLPDKGWQPMHLNVISSYVPQCPSEYIAKIIKVAPGGLVFANTNYSFVPVGIPFAHLPCYRFKIPASMDAYFDSLPNGNRKKLRSNWNKNKELTVEIATDFNITERLIEQNHAYWEDPASIYIVKKTHAFLEFWYRTFPDYVVHLIFKDNHNIIAHNVSLLQSGDLVDYICYRDTSDQYKVHGLGIFAILANIQNAILNQCQYYDLAFDFSQYKKQFMPQDWTATHSAWIVFDTKEEAEKSGFQPPWGIKEAI